MFLRVLLKKVFKISHRKIWCHTSFNTTSVLITDFFSGHLHFTVYATQGWCLKVKVVQSHTHFTASFALPSSFRVSSNSIYNLSLVGRMLVVISVLWCGIDMCCHASEKFQERKQLISKPDQHLLHINMKVIEKIKKRKKEITRCPIFWTLSFKNSGNSALFSQRTMCSPANSLVLALRIAYLLYLIVIWGRYCFACLERGGGVCLVWGFFKNFFSDHCSFIRNFELWSYKQP